MASEEDFSDSFDEDNTETLVRVAPKQAFESPRTKTGKKGPGAKRPASASKGAPYGPYSSRKSKNAKDLFTRSLKEGGSSGSKKDHVKGRSTQQYWSDTLRRTGVGFTTETANSDSFSGLKKSHTENMSYSSTSHYLRQMVGTEKSGQRPKTEKGKPIPGTPAYKSQEEYYDQILELKKQIKLLTTENSQMKSKVGRLEKENSKKEKEMEQLLDPSKSEEMRRTLADRRPDAGAVMHSLKQKILKLEQQLKEKESAYTKLQSDMKTTKIEELRLQTEAYYKEVIRLNHLKSEDLPTTRRTSGGMGLAGGKESPAKLKAMQDTMIKMNEKNYQLQVENKSLKQDLEKQMDKQKGVKERTADYQDMNKKELLSAINKLEKKIDKTEETTSMMSEVESRSGVTEGKIQLQGSAAQRLDQLDRRETELLDELKKKNDLVKKLKEDRTHYRKKCEEKDKEIKVLKKDVEELHAELDGFYDKDKRGTTPRGSPRRKSSEPMVQANKVRDQKSRPYKYPERAEEEREKDLKFKKQQAQKVEMFKKQRSAKVIQKSWRDHKQQKDDIDEAAELIQAYMRAHQTRSKTLKTHQRDRHYDDDDSEMGTESDITEMHSTYQSAKRGGTGRHSPVSKKTPPARRKPPLDDDTILYLQSTLRAHQARKSYLKNISQNSERPSSRFTSHSGRGLDSAGESEESDDFRSTALGSGRASSNSGYSAPNKFNRSKARSPLPKQVLSEEDSDDSDDDIVIGSSKKKFF